MSLLKRTLTVRGCSSALDPTAKKEASLTIAGGTETGPITVRRAPPVTSDQIRGRTIRYTPQGYLTRPGCCARICLLNTPMGYLN